MSRFIESYRDGALILLSPLFEREGVRHCFTTRIGGVSTGDYESLNLRLNCGDDPANVYENLRLVAAAVGFLPDACAMTRQVHGDIVRKIIAREAAFSPRADCDAVISDLPGHALISFGADCVTILLHDTKTGASAAVHAGWRGAAAGTLTRAVESLSREYGARPENIIAAIGPAISGERYEVGFEVAKALAEAHGLDLDRSGRLADRSIEQIMPKRGEKYFPDLRAFANMRLIRAGVPAGNIDADDHCTYSEPEKFWSHRRTGDRRGVQAAVIVIK